MNLEDFQEAAQRLYDQMDPKKRARFLAAMRLHKYQLNLDGVEAWVFWHSMVEHCFGDATASVYSAMKKTATQDRSAEEFVHFLRASQPAIYMKMPEPFWVLGLSLMQQRRDLTEKGIA